MGPDAEEAALATPREAGVWVQDRDLARALRRRRSACRPSAPGPSCRAGGSAQQTAPRPSRAQRARRGNGTAWSGPWPTSSPSGVPSSRPKPQKRRKGTAGDQRSKPVRQRLLETWIRKLVPLRQQQRAEQGQRQVARPPRWRAQRGKQARNRRPVDQPDDALQPMIAADTGRQQRLRKLPCPIRL
jgi:hypothetical protein